MQNVNVGLRLKKPINNNFNIAAAEHEIKQVTYNCMGYINMPTKLALLTLKKLVYLEVLYTRRR